MWLKKKVDAGASYVVTQMFFDNAKYYSFVDDCRKAGINVPIVPGIKPIVNINQLTMLPKTFKVDIPTALAVRMAGCAGNAEVKAVGVEWAVEQVKDLLAHGVKHVHFYSHNATPGVRAILERLIRG